MTTVAETRYETAEAMEAILHELEDEGGTPLSKRDLLDRLNGEEGRFTATALINAVMELLDQGEIEYVEDRQLVRTD